MTAFPPRSKVEKNNTWNAESVFSDIVAWESELKGVLGAAEAISRHSGHLGDGPAPLLQALRERDELYVRAQRVYMYAGFLQAVDTTNQAAAGMQGRAGGMYGRVLSAIAFFAPQLIGLGRVTLDEWTKQENGLAEYAHYFDDLFRRQAHVRSGEIEEVLGLLADPFEGPSTTANLLTNADFKFEAAETSKGKRLAVTQSSLDALLQLPDRKARQSAWNHYMDQYVAFRNTLASNLTTSIKANALRTQVRRHDSTLAASLFDNNVPPAVFHQLLATFKQYLPVWHKYFALRRKALGQRDLAYYDMWAPLTGRKVKVPFEQAVAMIAEGVSPLGDDYAATLWRGCLQERWVDWVPNRGKAEGAFSYGAPGTYPFVMMSYTDDVHSMSILAHELGHSMHSYLTWKTQPLVYSEYSLFVAEVASNFHQAMVRAHLLQTVKDNTFKIALLEEALRNFFRYFFQMPILARFELEAHERIERGDALTAEDMTQIMADLFAEAFGPEVKIDRPRVGMIWSTFGHLFADYYVYQYATGISGAHALASRVLRGESGAVDAYLGFLRAGGSKYPLDALRSAGVDLTTPRPVEETFGVMAEYIDRLEGLLK